MFGKKKILQPASVEASVEKPSAFEPYKDEPATWAEMSPEQLLEVWYHLADETATEPQPDEVDPDMWYLEAAHTGDAAAQYALGKYYNRAGNAFQAGMWFSKASAQGNPFAEYELAKLCENGIGMEVNKAEAHDRYEKAYAAFAARVAETPNKAIALKLAVMCDHNLVDAPEDESLKWHEMLKNRKEETRKAPEPVPQLVPPAEEPTGGLGEQPEQINSASTAANSVSELPSATKEVPEKTIAMQRRGILKDVPVEYILPSEDNPYSANDTEEDLYALAMSISASGLINPITLNQLSDNEYQIISGERRYHAIIRFLHWPAIPSIVHHNLSDHAAQLMLHSANLEVREYTAGQKLHFYIQTEKLLRKMQKSGEYTGGIQKGIAETLGISTHQVRKYKRILENLPQEQLDKVVNGSMSIERAYKLTVVSQADEPDAVEEPAGRTSVSNDLPEKPKEMTGRTSASGDQPEESEEPTGRTSASDDLPEKPEEMTGRTSAIPGPKNYFDALELLHGLPVEPGQLCAIINGDTVDGGTIDRIEIYENTILMSIMVDSLRRPYPITLLDQVIFVGTGCFDRAEAIVRGSN